MIVSIRKFLLINLLLALTVTTSLTALGNFYLDQQDIQEQLDIILDETAHALHAIYVHKVSPHSSGSIPKETITPNFNQRNFHYKEPSTWTTLKLSGKYQFQIWDDQGNLLLRSSKAPAAPLIGKQDGLSDKTINGVTWRVYTLRDDIAKLSFAVAEKYDMRNHLARVITEDDIYIMLLTYPLSGVLIWIIIGRGLSSLKRVATEVAHRAPTYLDPVEQESIPLEIRPLVAELNRLFVRLQQAFEREQRFAADAAHELRTPLAAIKTQAQVALRAHNDEERQKMLHNVINGVDRGVHIVQQLLTLSRLAPESGVLEDIHTVNLVKLSSDIIAQLAPIAFEKNINIELIAPETAAIEVSGNTTALSILLRNLVDNAIRYTPEGGNVRVVVESLADANVLKVIDNGPGIPEELRSRVFERFYRILGSASPGSGLGLAIVQKIAILHNADIKLSTPASQQGLEISITFAKPNKD